MIEYNANYFAGFFCGAALVLALGYAGRALRYILTEL